MLLAYLFRHICGVLVLVHLGLRDSCSRQEPNNDGRGNVPLGKLSVLQRLELYF